MRRLNRKHIEAVIDLINRGPYLQLLSMTLVDLGMDYSVLHADVENKHFNPFGSIHGGVYASIIDTAAYWAMYCQLDENAGLVSLDLKVNNLAPFRNGRLIVRGESLKFGKTICLAQGLVATEDGKMIAHGTSTLMQTPGMQTIEQAFQFAGEQLPPPKFL